MAFSLLPFPGDWVIDDPNIQGGTTFFGSPSFVDGVFVLNDYVRGAVSLNALPGGGFPTAIRVKWRSTTAEPNPTSITVMMSDNDLIQVAAFANASANDGSLQTSTFTAVDFVPLSNPVAFVVLIENNTVDPAVHEIVSVEVETPDLLTYRGGYFSSLTSQPVYASVTTQVASTDAATVWDALVASGYAAAYCIDPDQSPWVPIEWDSDNNLLYDNDLFTGDPIDAGTALDSLGTPHGWGLTVIDEDLLTHNVVLKFEGSGMASPLSTTANVQIALNQILEGVTSSPGRPAVTAFGYTIVSECPINSHQRSMYVLGGPKGAQTGTGVAYGAPGGAAWVDVSLSSSATAMAALVLVKLQGSKSDGSPGTSGPFG